MSAPVHTFTCYEDSPPSLMARVTGRTGANITQASLTSITLYGYNIANVASPVASGVALTVSSVVFDTLQTDARWTEDDTGYNFRYDLPASYIATPGEYLFEFVFDPTSGENFVLVWNGYVKPLQNS